MTSLPNGPGTAELAGFPCGLSSSMLDLPPFIALVSPSGSLYRLELCVISQGSDLGTSHLVTHTAYG